MSYVANFLASVFGFLGAGLLDVIVLIVSTAICALLAAGALSCIQDVALRGKPDYNQEGAAAILVGIIFGGVIAFALSLYFLCTSATGAAVMSMLGVACLEIAVIIVTLIVGKILQNRRYKGAAESEPERHRPF